MKLRGLAACAVALVVAGMVAGVAAGTAKPKPPKHKPKPHASVTAVEQRAEDALYDCAKYASAAQFTALAGGWGGTYTLKQHYRGPVRAVYGVGGVSDCEYTPSAGYGTASVVVYYGKKAGPASYAGWKQTATIRGSQFCSNLAPGTPPPDPRHCGPVAIPGLGDQAFAGYGYVAVLRGPVALIVALPSTPDPTGNRVASQDLCVSMAEAVLAKVPVKTWP